MQQLLEKASDRCQICNKKYSEDGKKIDHYHKIGIVKGVICCDCNVVIGLFEKSTEVFKKAIDYLNTNS
jgi:hypothetical protein